MPLFERMLVFIINSEEGAVDKCSLILMLRDRVCNLFMPIFLKVMIMNFAVRKEKKEKKRGDAESEEMINCEIFAHMS